MEKKEKLLRKVTLKIRLSQKEYEEEIVVEVLLDSWATVLVMNSEFVKKKQV